MPLGKAILDRVALAHEKSVSENYIFFLPPPTPVSRNWRTLTSKKRNLVYNVSTFRLRIWFENIDMNMEKLEHFVQFRYNSIGVGTKNRHVWQIVR